MSRFDPPQPGLPPLPPGFRPGDIPRSGRYQKFEYDASLTKRSFIKSLILLIAGLGIIAAWKSYKPGPDEAVAYLIRYASALGLSLGIYFMCCLLKVFDYSGPLPRAILAVAGALAAADLTQFLLGQTAAVYLLGVPWLAAAIVFTGLATDLLDLELTEAGLFAVFTYGGKVLLKFMIFDQLAPKS